MLAAGWTPRSGEELAIGAGSHNGEDGHRDLAAAMLAAAGLGPDDLGCPPACRCTSRRAPSGWLAGRAPERLAMNCSGKHAAMLSACVAAGWPTEGYLDRDHPLQQAIEARLAEAAGEPVTAVVVDGCGAPQHALSVDRAGPRRAVAGPGAGGQPRAGGRPTPCAPSPGSSPGTGREDTDLMRAVPGLLVKGGADGVHVAARARAAGRWR